MQANQSDYDFSAGFAYSPPPITPRPEPVPLQVAASAISEPPRAPDKPVAPASETVAPSTVESAKNLEMAFAKTPDSVPSVPISPKRDFFTVGSTKDEVLAMQGTPTSFSEQMFWYGSSSVQFQNGKVQFDKFSIVFNGAIWDAANAAFSDDSIQTIANKFINTPYLWGGRSVFGIDCSGFVQQVYRFFNKSLPRDAYEQATVGEVVGFLQEVQCGDLAFFDNEEGRIIHVGILFNSDTIIHSAGKVRVDKIDTMGIVNTDTGERTHKLRIIKRY